MTTGIKNPSKYYIELINAFPPRPITNEAELIATQKQINSLLDKKQLTQDDQDYLKVLGMLVYEYEEKHEQIPEIKGVELLKAASEEFGVYHKDLINIFNSELVILDILQGKQQLTREQEQQLIQLFCNNC